MKAHFEINLVPLTINITQNFYKKIMVFCFPEKAIQDEAALQKQKESKQVGTFHLIYIYVRLFSMTSLHNVKSDLIWQKYGP